MNKDPRLDGAQFGWSIVGCGFFSFSFITHFLAFLYIVADPDDFIHEFQSPAAAATPTSSGLYDIPVHGAAGGFVAAPSAVDDDNDDDNVSAGGSEYTDIPHIYSSDAGSVRTFGEDLYPPVVNDDRVEPVYEVLSIGAESNVFSVPGSRA
jgi:hypothetical protein